MKGAKEWTVFHNQESCREIVRTSRCRYGPGIVSENPAREVTQGLIQMAFAVVEEMWEALTHDERWVQIR